jgi:hypothetical protein
MNVIKAERQPIPSSVHDHAYDLYELLEEEALARLRDADDMSDSSTNHDGSSDADTQ